MERGFLEDCLANGMSLEAIGKRVGKHPSTVGYWLKKHGMEARGREKYARRGALRKDELKALAEQNATVREMAERLDRNPSTIPVLAPALRDCSGQSAPSAAPGR